MNVESEWFSQSNGLTNASPLVLSMTNYLRPAVIKSYTSASLRLEIMTHDATSAERRDDVSGSDSNVRKNSNICFSGKRNARSNNDDRKDDDLKPDTYLHHATTTHLYTHLPTNNHHISHLQDDLPQSCASKLCTPTPPHQNRGTLVNNIVKTHRIHASLLVRVLLNKLRPCILDEPDKIRHVMRLHA